MPCDYNEYHPRWSLISRLIRTHRAGNKCEFCGVPNGALIMRFGKQFRLATIWEYDTIEAARENGGGSNRRAATKALGLTWVVLTVAHMDHDKTNNRFSNLKALCQSCHLSHDIAQHVENRKYGRHWKGAQQGKLPFD